MKRIIWMSLLLLWCLLPFVETHAEIKDPDELAEAKWEYVHEASVINKKGWVQSVCVTDNYIVCFENASNKKSIPDTLIAFYKNDYDEEGNPVEQYSYAKHVTELDYEHGNGMTYNPNTHEIYIAAGPLVDPANAGNIYVVDADTLMYKRTINVGGGVYNFWCISYSVETRQYILQINYAGGRSFLIADEDFNIVDSFPDNAIVPDTSLQDFCVSGDYIFSMSYDKVTKIDNYINVYSISGRYHVGTYHTSLPATETKVESESICEVEPGKFFIIAATNKPSRLRFYQTKITAIFDIVTDVEKGKISESTYHAEEGKDYLVAFQPKKNHELAELIVDGKVVESQPDQNSYTFKDLKANHTISARFTKIPKYKITTSVTNGTITESKSVFRDKNYKVEYQPDEYYELYQIKIDGETIDINGRETEYNFRDIQGAHSIEVEFKEIPSWTIETSVVNGTITPSIRKAYRDTTQKVSYTARENYLVRYIEVDGKRINKNEFYESFTFSNIQQGHTICVVYVWKYLYISVGSGILAVVLLLGYLRLKIRRKRLKKRKRKH